jgi:HK97 family phage major capsid protein
MPAILDDQLTELTAAITSEEEKARSLKEAVDADRDERAAAGVNFMLDDTLFEEFNARYEEADQIAAGARKLRQRREDILARMAKDDSRNRGPLAPQGGDFHERGLRESIAQRYLQSDAYKRLLESGALTGSNSRVNHDPVEVVERGGVDANGDFDSPLARALQPGRERTTVNVGDAGAVVPIDQQVWPPVAIPVRQVQLLDLISISATESDMVNWVKQSVRSDYAAETPYGTAAPEADYEFSLQQASVKRIPSFIPATKDVLADQGQLQPLLQEQLMTGVRLKLESQFLSGAGSSGTDSTFQGILNASGIGTVTYQSGTGHTSEYQLDVYHRAITTIRLTLFADPTAIVQHPTDYEWAVLKRDTYGRYLFTPNTEDGVQDIWGLNTVISPVISAGTALVGDFKQGAHMWLRTGLSVTASTEHLDFFTRGMVAILAEMRAAFAVVQPRAFCQVLSLTGP